MKRPPRRLDAFLARAGLASRQGAKRMIRSGRVKVDGVVCKKTNTMITDRQVTCDDQPVELLAIEHVILHKPIGFACSHNPVESPILDELLPVEWQTLGLEPAGRLDRDTSGLLILSSDGGLIHRLTSPQRKLPKRYQVGFTGTLPDAVERCAAGVRIDEDDQVRLTRPATLVLGDPGHATLTLYEGRYRQVRRMFVVLGAEVETLHRDRVGGLELPDDLPPGEARPLSADQLEALWRGQPA